MRPRVARTLAAVALLALCGSCASQDPREGRTPSEGDLRVVSLNVHYLEPERDQTDWSHRRQAVTSALLDLSPDLILFQEMETFEGGEGGSKNLQRDWVLATVPGYTAGANGEATRFPITQPIFFRTNRFRLVDQGWFFFSNTPDTLYARTWTGSWPSFTSWVLLEETATGRRLYVYNTHPEAFNEEVLRRGIELVAQRVRGRAHPGVAVLLGGDFNQFGGDRKLVPLASAGLVRAPADAPSFHFQLGFHLYPAIDHLFATSELQWQYGGAVQKRWAGLWPSDHHPVLAVYRWISAETTPRPSATTPSPPSATPSPR